MKNSILRAPGHLRPDTKAWWLYVHSNWRLEAHHSRLFEMACDAWDRYHEAREILARDGIVIGGRQAAVRPHPAIAIERDNRIIFAKLIAQLSLDGEPSEIDPNVRAAKRSTRPGGWRASSNGQTQQQNSTGPR
jgi:P27 family predicted phage terminase small subunit